MLLRKIVLGRKEITPEVTIESAIKEIGRIFGEKLWRANVEIRKDSSFKFCNASDEDADETQQEKHRKWCNNALELIKKSGRKVSFNSEEVASEEDIDVDIDIEAISKNFYEDESQLNEDDLLSYYFISKAAETYHTLELGKIDKRRINEYNRFIRNLFRFTGVHSISFKIVKFGGKKYSLFTIN